ncbi:aerial mycelium formation protein [Egibacter rhizosphaerae]|uniref:Aerial mycelium formation protein n=1 Tax=Egibacter rhizosphaerae TaxID=1670831 RepID=A0A411YGH8_9ACTN|nr:aerial mycelium formation protein [Egibacter rhizosphaerae]QBI20251.1 aerial mycelium formation protein [Egibacter rhizosphaerae]
MSGAEGETWAGTGRRRIDRVTDPSLPNQIPELPTGRVRQLRDECREEEARLSYTRRLLHGRLDIARAEALRRSGDDDDILARLPEILAGDENSRGAARALGFYEPGEREGRRVEDRVLDDSALAQLPEFDERGLAEFLAEIEEVERRVSEQRRVVLDHLDRLQAELVARYRDGRAHIGEVVSPSAPSGGDRAGDDDRG